jgi:hypothetical protein
MLLKTLLSQMNPLRLLSFKTWYLVAWKTVTNDLQEPVASFFRVTAGRTSYLTRMSRIRKHPRITFPYYAHDQQIIFPSGLFSSRVPSKTVKLLIVDSLSTDQEISGVIWNSEVQPCFHKSPSCSCWMSSRSVSSILTFSSLIRLSGAFPSCFRLTFHSRHVPPRPEMYK